MCDKRLVAIRDTNHQLLLLLRRHSWRMITCAKLQAPACIKRLLKGNTTYSQNYSSSHRNWTIPPFFLLTDLPQLQNTSHYHEMRRNMKWMWFWQEKARYRLVRAAQFVGQCTCWRMQLFLTPRSQNAIRITSFHAHAQSFAEGTLCVTGSPVSKCSTKHFAASSKCFQRSDFKWTNQRNIFHIIAANAWSTSLRQLNARSLWKQWRGVSSIEVDLKKKWYSISNAYGFQKEANSNNYISIIRVQKI